jgi:hypothetical protein
MAGFAMPGGVLGRDSDVKQTLLAAALLTAAACDRTGELWGWLVLRPGEEADMTGCLVELLVRDDTLYRTVDSLRSGPVGADGRSGFRFASVPLGTYYIRAWRDIDLDDSISDGDLVGVVGGEYSRTSNGSGLWMRGAWNWGVGDIEVRHFVELEFHGSGRRVEQDTTTEFSYSFSRDVHLATLEVTFPFYGKYLDHTAPGPKLADTTYRSSHWRLSSGPMPAGEHLLRFRGRFQQAEYDTILRVSVP